MWRQLTAQGVTWMRPRVINIARPLKTRKQGGAVINQIQLTTAQIQTDTCALTWPLQKI